MIYVNASENEEMERTDPSDVFTRKIQMTILDHSKLSFAQKEYAVGYF